MYLALIINYCFVVSLTMKLMWIVFVIFRKHAEELSSLHQKLGNLSSQIKHLQNITKPYKKVKKLSYGEKKRILVNIFLFRQVTFSLFLNM